MDDALVTKSVEVVHRYYFRNFLVWKKTSHTRREEGTAQAITYAEVQTICRDLMKEFKRRK